MKAKRASTVESSVFHVIVMLGCLLGLCGIQVQAFPGPQDKWFEEDCWHSYVDEGVTNYLGKQLCAMAVGPDGNLYLLDSSTNRVVVFQQDGTFVRQWGEPGSESGQFNFNNSSDVAFDSTGRVYIADYSNDRIQVFEQNGTFVTNWGSRGSEDTQFYGPRGIEIGPDGLVYVADYHNYRVMVFEQDGTFVRKWGGQGTLDGQFEYSPCGIVFDANGLVYVFSYQKDKHTEVFNTDGTFVKSLAYSVGYEPVLAEGIFWGQTGVMSTDGADWLTDGNYYCHVDRTNIVPSLVGSENGTYFSRLLRRYSRNGVTYENGTVVKSKRRYETNPILEWKAGIGAVPEPVVLKFEQRPGSYVMDIEYMIKDADSTNVQVQLAAIVDGRERLDTVIPVRTCLEGTSGNIGEGILPNVTNRVVWDITEDVDREYVDLRMAVMAHDERGLWDVEFITMPAEGEDPELTISRYRQNDDYLLPVWQWLLTCGDEGVAFMTNGVYATEGTYAGQRLVYDAGASTYYDGQITMTVDGWNFLSARMGYRMATSEEKQRAYNGRDWNNYEGSTSGEYFIKE